MKRFIGLALVLAVWTVGGCASAHPASEFAPPVMPWAGRITVQVENHHVEAVNVFIIHDGLKVRLGMVIGMSSEEFQVRGNVITGARELRLTAEPIGYRDAYVTEAILPMPWQSVKLHVANNVLLSRYSMR